MGNRTSVYLDGDHHAAVKASVVLLAELVRRGLGLLACKEPLAELAAHVHRRSEVP